MNTAMIFVVVALLLSILGLTLVSCLALYYRQRSATRTESQCQSGENVLIASSFSHFISVFRPLSQSNAISPQSHL